MHVCDVRCSVVVGSLIFVTFPFPCSLRCCRLRLLRYIHAYTDSLPAHILPTRLLTVRARVVPRLCVVTCLRLRSRSAAHHYARLRDVTVD